MNIPITPPHQAMNDFVFRSADRMRIDGCTNAIAREGLSLALQCEHEALIDHYLGLLLARLKQQAPEHSIEVYFPTNTDSLLARFNEVLVRQSVEQATQSPQASSKAQIWVVHDAHALPENEIQLLARLIQNFPGANIRAILLMIGSRGTHHSLASFGRKILRWEIEAPNEEQSQAALELARTEGRSIQVQQLLKRIQQRRWQETESPTAMTPDDFAPAPPRNEAPKISIAPSSARIDGFYQRGLDAIRTCQRSLKQLRGKHLKTGLLLGVILAAAALVMLWVQPEAFGIGKAPTSTTKANANAVIPTPGLPGSTEVNPANTADNPGNPATVLSTPTTSR
jgi:hypothetical protein